ncbi:hypothetical protein PanWU01x14_082600, partial [Parasponia andersonii]
MFSAASSVKPPFDSLSSSILSEKNAQQVRAQHHRSSRADHLGELRGHFSHFFIFDLI